MRPSRVGKARHFNWRALPTSSWVFLRFNSNPIETDSSSVFADLAANCTPLPPVGKLGKVYDSSFLRGRLSLRLYSAPAMFTQAQRLGREYENLRLRLVGNGKNVVR